MRNAMPQVPIEFLIELRQGLEEESRLFNQLKGEAKRTDEDLELRYHRILECMVKLSLIAHTVKTKNTEEGGVA